MPVLVPDVLRRRLHGAQEVIADELAALADPKSRWRRLAWSDKLFAVAATERVVGTVIAALQNERIGENSADRYRRVMDFCLAETLRKVRYRSCSTLSTSNLLDNCEMSEWAAVYEILRDSDHV